MKKWTIVVEITDEYDENPELALNRSDLERDASEALEGIFSGSGSSFQIMEIIEAPYGPQHPNGVFLDERQMPKKPRWPNE